VSSYNKPPTDSEITNYKQQLDAQRGTFKIPYDLHRASENTVDNYLIRTYGKFDTPAVRKLKKKVNEREAREMFRPENNNMARQTRYNDMKKSMRKNWNHPTDIFGIHRQAGGTNDKRMGKYKCGNHTHKTKKTMCK
jgi:hypothetical protein